MTIKIYNNTMIDCGVGISSPKDANVEIGANNFKNCGTAIELRDPPSFIEHIGLRADTPVEKVIAILQSIDNGELNNKNLDHEIEKSGLFDYLSAGANASTLISAFMQLSASDQIQQVLALFSK